MMTNQEQMEVITFMRGLNFREDFILDVVFRMETENLSFVEGLAKVFPDTEGRVFKRFYHE